ncbi:MAG TPA: dihydrolipoyl dehydrogenase [Clostridia bacterium]|nr:dihydrolipoyl dehydrogenase [Clostridia bacterium]
MSYDIVVIGSGPGGYVAAVRAAQLGAKVAVVEARDIGGTCLNRGCIPTKALVRSAEIYDNVKSSKEYGVSVSGFELDFARVMERKREVVQRLVSGVEKLFDSNGVEVFRGKGSIPRPGVVEVTLNGEGGKKVLETKNIIIATGSGHALPPIPPDDIRLAVSSDDALEFQRPPKSMVIIGGGVLGIEFACIYHSFGTEIDVIKRSPLILPPVDDELSKRLMPVLKRKGIRINTGIYIKGIEALPDGTRRVVADTKDGKEVSFEAETVLIAMGRVPDFGGLDLDGLGIAYSKKGIEVDQYMQTSVPGIYAIGDVVGRFYLAPVASAEGILVVENIMNPKERRPMDYSCVPQCVFSSPEAASVGLTETQAREAGYDIKVSKFPFSANGKAVALGETEGLVKVVADGPTGRILGMHILGPHATDLIHEGALAVKLGAHAKDVAYMIHAHPTLPEAVMEAAHGIEGHPIHLAKIR